MLRPGRWLRASIMRTMRYIPTQIYTASQVRALDRVAIDDYKIAGYTLMTRAGEAALDTIGELWPRARRILVLCGAGNNAGDGYVLARLALADAAAVTVVQLGQPDKLRGDAARAWSDFAGVGGEVTVWDPGLLDHADVVVDALLGTGLDRPLGGR